LMASCGQADVAVAMVNATAAASAFLIILCS
jgi:hypothetical protein